MERFWDLLTPEEQRDLVRWYLESGPKVIGEHYGPLDICKKLARSSNTFEYTFPNTITELTLHAVEMLGFKNFSIHWDNNPEEWRAVGNLMAALLAEMFGLKEEDYA